MFLSIVGFIVPYSSFLPFPAHNGLALSLFVNQMFAGRIASSFEWDVIVSGLVLVLFVLVDSRRNQVKC
ncbi:MAG: DUF2834 domain-containing protein [Chloroflexi bacterium]|nr:DUF2834 domain-containing protein [Chloroflexota bacterium]